MDEREEFLNGLIKRQGERLTRLFMSSTVAVCGLGGLGSNIAVMLCRAGVGKLILIDFDVVEASNLNRQSYFLSQIGMDKTEATLENLKRITPVTEVVAKKLYIDGTNAQDATRSADVVCEAFDNPFSKAALVDAILEKTDSFVVASSGMAGLDSSDEIKTRRIGKRLIICGDGKSEASPGVPLLSSRVMLCAAHQAHETLRILAGEYSK